jgi:molybdate transport system substrate-binding protein
LRSVHPRFTNCQYRLHHTIAKLDIPDALNTIATYPIAPISDSKNADLANAFVALVLSPDGQAILVKYGFIPAAGQ